MLGAYRHSPCFLLACNAKHPLDQDGKVSHSHRMVALQGRCLWLWHASLNKLVQHRLAAVNQLSVSSAGTVAGRHGGGPPPTEVERGGCLAASALDGSCSKYVSSAQHGAAAVLCMKCWLRHQWLAPMCPPSNHGSIPLRMQHWLCGCSQVSKHNFVHSSLCKGALYSGFCIMSQ